MPCNWTVIRTCLARPIASRVSACSLALSSLLMRFRAIKKHNKLNKMMLSQKFMNSLQSEINWPNRLRICVKRAVGNGGSCKSSSSRRLMTTFKCVSQLTGKVKLSKFLKVANRLSHYKTSRARQRLQLHQPIWHTPISDKFIKLFQMFK